MCLGQQSFPARFAGLDFAQDVGHILGHALEHFAARQATALHKVVAHVFKRCPNAVKVRTRRHGRRNSVLEQDAPSRYGVGYKHLANQTAGHAHQAQERACLNGDTFHALDQQVGGDVFAVFNHCVVRLAVLLIVKNVWPRTTALANNSHTNFA